MLYACFTLIGSWKDGEFFLKKLVRVGLQEINNVFRPKWIELRNYGYSTLVSEVDTGITLLLAILFLI